MKVRADLALTFGLPRIPLTLSIPFCSARPPRCPNPPLPGSVPPAGAWTREAEVLRLRKMTEVLSLPGPCWRPRAALFNLFADAVPVTNLREVNNLVLKRRGAVDWVEKPWFLLFLLGDALEYSPVPLA
ncbi:hypothetical protein H920_00615 [Fukomys damarensis]|uniref:Uncharacterized protein n=1 Tax=Fukomys damarensis TaxID=885580 RepID=A0A091E5X8_FUKDA|nr:hypothetical protein H920_00615 [Fukomys damarensis]